MINEQIFLLYILFLSSACIVALKFAKEALVALICTQVILANLFVVKQINLFGLTATASDALAVGAALGLNLLQEYYKKPIAIKTIWISFLCMITYTIASILHLSYASAQTDTTQICFENLLTPMPRIAAASLFTYVIVQNLDCWLYGCLLEKFKGTNFVGRNYISVSITQLLDTVLFSFLGLYGINEEFSSINKIFQIIVVSYAIKLMIILLATPFLALTKKFIRHEQV
ncbi:queuosine precursor transporter [Candidatus Dependentiae bacterium]|nr:queuosine precursor transporter [Candidatus Dependentiae bacterium]